MIVPHATLEDLMVTLVEANVGPSLLVNLAITQARLSHGAQKRDDGSSYIRQHIFPVTISVIEFYRREGIELTPPVVAAALLHDVMEDDASMTPEIFVSRFGAETYGFVETLTKPDYGLFPGKTPEEQKGIRDGIYFAGIADGPFAVKVIKLHDRLNNLACLSLSNKPGKKESYIQETEMFHLPLARSFSSDIYQKMSDLVEKLKLS